MATNYTTIPTGRPESTPTTEPYSGAYYYKYSYYWAGKSVSTKVNFIDLQLKRDDSLNNNAYIFLACIGPSFNPPEFGIMSGHNDGGKWYCYTREAGSTVISKYNMIFSPDVVSPTDGIYKYTSTTEITMKITLSGVDIIGTIERNGNILKTITVSGSAAGINENVYQNDFLSGVSYVPVPGTTSPGGRNAFMKHVYLQDSKVYKNSNYQGESEIWEPDTANTVTHYGLIYNTDFITYNRFGTSDEEISIDYN